MTRAICLLIIGWLLAACGSSEIPTMAPTPTPIPGFVGGEEPEAYASFIRFYAEEVIDCTWGMYVETDLATSLDTDYRGKAIYVGDGIWRFYVRTAVVDTTIEFDQATYDEKVIDWRSLSDRTWEDKCNRKWKSSRDEEYSPEPPDDYKDFDPPEPDLPAP